MRTRNWKADNESYFSPGYSGIGHIGFRRKGRQVAGEAKNAYGEAVVQARDATQSVRRSVGQQPLVSLVIAGVVGYVLSLVVPHR
jgi:hypothetical protein